MPKDDPGVADPLQLTGCLLSSEESEAALDIMAETFIDEFLRMGWKDEQLLELFHNPFYRGPHAVWRARGEGFVASLIAKRREALRSAARRR